MDGFLAFAFFALAIHMIDASRHFWHEKETFSAISNFVLGIVSVVLGFVFLF